MFKKAFWGIKIIAIINIVVNLLLLVPWYVILGLMGPIIHAVGLVIISTNIILGIGIILLKNWARVSFIIMQAAGLVFSIYPFRVILQFGLGNPSGFGDNHELWELLLHPCFGVS